MANKRRIMSTSSCVFLFLSFLILILQNSSTIRGFAQMQAQSQTEQKASSALDNNQPKISDHIFTTLRKNNALYDLQRNITLSDGKDMTYVDITADGKIVAATSSGDNQAFIFDGTNDKLIDKINVGSTPKGVKISPDKRYVFVANEVSGSVSIIDLQNLKVIKEIKVGPVPHNI